MVKNQSTSPFIDEGGYVDLAMQILKTCKNLLLVGDTGVGKTHLAHYLNSPSLLGGLPFFEKTMNENTSQWDLIACDILEKGDTKIRDGPVVLWLKSKKGILVLDSLNLALANSATLIESLGDWRQEIYIPEYQQVFKRSPEHYLIATMNPHEKGGYTGTHQLNIATLRRFEGIELTWISPMEESKLIMKYFKDYEWVRKLVAWANKTRNLYHAGQLVFPITTGNLINYAMMKSRDVSDSQILTVATIHYIDVQRSTVRRLWEQAKKASIEDLEKEDASKS